MTRPSVLAGPESVREHLANAAQILQALDAETMRRIPGPLMGLWADIAAVEFRVRAALQLLEGDVVTL